MVDGLKPPQKTSMGKVRLLPRGRVMISDSSVAGSYSILSIREYEADPLTSMTSEVVEYRSPLTAAKTLSAPSTESAVAGVATKERLFLLNYRTFDWCCFYCFVRNSLVALLEALCARIFSLDSWISGFSWHFFWCVCKVSNKAFLLPLSTRLLCLVVAIPLVCWLYTCACVCVPLYVHVKMCR